MSNYTRLLFFCICFLLSSYLYAQDNTQVLEQKAKNSIGVQRVEALLELSETYRLSRDIEKAISSASEAVTEATVLRNDILIARASIQKGMLHRNRGASELAITLLLRGLKAAERANNEAIRTDALHKVAVTYLLMRDYAQSYKYAIEEEQAWQKIGDQKGLASALNLKGISLIYLERPSEAIISLEQGLEIAEQIEDNDLRYKLLLNKGDALLKLRKYDEALVYMDSSRLITEKMNDKYGMAVNLLKLGEVYSAKGELVKALGITKQGLNFVQKLKFNVLERNAYEALTQIYFKQGEYKKAFESQSTAVAMNDSLANISSRHQATNMQLYYEAERQQRQNQLLKEERQNTNLKLYLASAMALIGFLIGGIYIARSRVKKKAIDKLRRQNDEIKEVYDQVSHQAMLIEGNNNKLTESINYARRIQDAIQVNTTGIFEDFQDYFVIDRPKDIVSGDCYWFEQKENEYYIALSDCTGHGIPGAFMTILCNSLLNDIFNSYRGSRSPAEMLMELHRRLIHHLHKSQSNVQDGMDIAICRINPDEKTLTYAGAKMPLLYIDQKGEFQRFRANSLPIGGHEVKIKRKYEDITIYYQEGDVFYLTSDGYQDQFGGQNDKKFKSKKLYEMLIQIHRMPLKKQKNYLEQQLNAWQGSNKQTDDIMFVGIRLK